MTASQILTLLVLAAVVAALIWDKVRADIVALAGAAFLLVTGVVRPVEVTAFDGATSDLPDRHARLFDHTHDVRLRALAARYERGRAGQRRFKGG